MRQENYIVTKDGKQMGPYAIEKVNSMISQKEIIWSDYLYDEDKKDWLLILEHPVFADRFTPELDEKTLTEIKSQLNANAKNSKESFGELKSKAWYILRDGNNFGPFSKLDLVQMLQSKTLYEFDYAWQFEMKGWKRIAEISEFKPEHIRELKDSGVIDISEVFFRRRHMRAKFGCSLIVHNNKTVFKGQSLEIGAGGAGLLIDSQDLQPGQTLFLHFKPGDGVPPFNAICQVVSKQFVQKKIKAVATTRYGVKFTSISSQVRDTLEVFAKQKSAS